VGLGHEGLEAVLLHLEIADDLGKKKTADV